MVAFLTGMVLEAQLAKKKPVLLGIPRSSTNSRHLVFDAVKASWKSELWTTNIADFRFQIFFIKVLESASISDLHRFLN